MEEILKEASFESKQTRTIPVNAQVTKSSYRMNVEEIENGFILSKCYDIEYITADGNNDYLYYTKKWYTKDNPMTVTLPKEKDLSLAEKLD